MSVKIWMVALLTAGLSIPAASAQLTPSPNLAGIAHVAIRVRDLDAAVVFYKKLGFVEAFALSRDGKIYEAFLKINDHQFIELYPATPKDSQIGFLHVCFEGDNLQALHDYYVSKGLTPTAVKTAGAGNLLFTMPGPMTPTGPQNLEYTQYMPGSMHSKDFGKDLGSDRISTKLTGVSVATNDPAAARAFYIDKLGFSASWIPLYASRLMVPHLAGFVEIEPAALGFKARITFSVDSSKAATTALESHGLTFSETDYHNYLVLDPDGNEILFAPPIAMRAVPMRQPAP